MQRLPAKLTFFAALAIFFPLLPSFAGEGENLIPNGDVENASKLNSEGVPYGMSVWTSVHDHPIARFLISHDQTTSGTNSLSIERLDKTGIARIGISPEIAVEEGKRYTFSFQVKATEGRPDVYFDFLSAPGKFIEPNIEEYSSTTLGVEMTGRALRFALDALQNINQFNQLNLTFTVPKGVKFMKFNAGFSDTMGTAWFDDFKLVPAN